MDREEAIKILEGIQPNEFLWNRTNCQPKSDERWEAIKFAAKDYLSLMRNTNGNLKSYAELEQEIKELKGIINHGNS